MSVVYCLLIILLLGCKTESEDGNTHSVYNSKEYTVELVDANTPIHIPLDQYTIPVTRCLQRMGDTLAYLRDSSILLIDLKTKTNLRSINFPKNNPYGIVSIHSFTFKNADSLFLTTNVPDFIFLSDKNGRIKDKFPARKGYLFASYSGSTGGNTPFFNDNKLFFNVACALAPWDGDTKDELEEESPTMAIDLRKHSFDKISFSIKNKHNWNFGNEPYPSVVFDGNRILYSFLSNHKVYAYKDEATITADASSDYFTKFMKKLTKEDYKSMDSLMNKVLTGDEYALLTYDPYRNVYYRFMYCAIDTKGKTNLKRLAFMRPEFSILVLDKNLQKIGETKMPVGRHVAFNHFVTPEGLYISDNHFLNKDANEEVLTFTLYKLEKRTN